MAKLTVPTNLSLAILFLLAITASIARAQQAKEIKMSLYFQDISSGPNATVIPVAGIAAKHWTFTQFGTIFVTDEPITETADPNSAPVGRAQGIYATSALDGLNAHVMISIVFTNGEYGGSTLQIQGSSKQFEGVREVAVVAGTGLFRYARGYATFETYYLDIPAAYSIIRCNISVLHYSDCGLQSPFSFPSL
ncbi:dirigent protein 22 [Ricinus communis]|uniref:Dirigent protein n=1 Tax=Ricinus communis TaxID=3988 RepID=B9SFR3_RICCO|nr:dirigent protein 22 [Ricinus communis]EEF37552.1 conserved hypothetical protein [Ricinus communis]|eukprot:XP_002524832.1 dirigent protein 22 [Ricinus communis]